MSTHADVLQAAEDGDAQAVAKLFPAYLREYRASVVPEPDLKLVKSGRFDKYLRLLGRPDGDDYHKYLAAAVTDLRESDPDVCIQGGIVNAFLFRVLAEKLPPPTVLAHMRAAQVESMGMFAKASPTTVPEHLAALQTMSETERKAATAHDSLMKAWFQGLFTGGRGVYDDFLQGALRATVEPYRKLLAELPESDTKQRQQYETMIQHTKTMMLPGQEPELRPPLPELPLLGIDCDYDTFADAVSKGHFYPFLALDEHAAATAQQLLVLRAVEKGEIDASEMPKLEDAEATPARLGRQAALSLAMHMAVPVIHGLWTHASLLPGSGALERLGEVAARWHLHGKRQLLLTGSVPPGLEGLASQRSSQRQSMPLHRISPEVPSEATPMSSLQRNPLGLGVIAAGPPVDLVLPAEDRWDIADHAEDSASLVTARMAAHSFMSNAPRFSDMISAYLSKAIPAHLAEFSAKGQPEPQPDQAFAEDPGFCKPRSVDELLRPPTDEQMWAVLGATVAPGCLAAMHHFNNSGSGSA